MDDNETKDDKFNPWPFIIMFWIFLLSASNCNSINNEKSIRDYQKIYFERAIYDLKKKIEILENKK